MSTFLALILTFFGVCIAFSYFWIGFLIVLEVLETGFNELKVKHLIMFILLFIAAPLATTALAADNDLRRIKKW